MEAKKAKVLAAAAAAALLTLILTLYLRFKLSKPFYFSAAAILAAALLIALLILLRRANAPTAAAASMARRPVLDGEELRVEYSFLRKVAGLPTSFSPEQLAAATDGFRCAVGRGSSGEVYRGILDDGTAVAVKRLDCAARRDREFRAEVAAIAGAQHVNLVRLLGFCLAPHGPCFLVYEFMPNGSLDRWLFDGGRRCLPWDVRRRVAADVARALAYIHHDCRAKVLHLDVKPENILLDEGFRALLADFGLSRLMGRDESRVVTTVRGTTGYLAPEWLLGAGVTEKCDVYSYGMVLLELVGGRRNLVRGEGGRWSYFPRAVAERSREGRVMEVVDPRLAAAAGAVEEAEVRTLVHVALWCIQEKAAARPAMARVVHMLEGRAAVEAPPLSEMPVLDLLEPDETRGERGRFGGLGTALGWPGGRNVSPAMSYSIEMSSLSGR